MKVQGSFIFTDIVKSSKLWTKYPKKMNKAIEKHEKIISKIALKRGGIIVKSIGDAMMLFFKGSNGYKQAIESAILIQEIFTNGGVTLSNRDTLQIRVGICHGEANTRKVKYQGITLDDFFGNAVNIASRMESKVSNVGEIAIAFFPKTTREQEKYMEKLTDEFTIDAIDYKDSCIDGYFKRSGRIAHTCKSVEDLHGVPSVQAYVIKE
jgi:hypothetical protein